MLLSIALMISIMHPATINYQNTKNYLHKIAETISVAIIPQAVAEATCKKPTEKPDVDSVKWNTYWNCRYQVLKAQIPIGTSYSYKRVSCKQNEQEITLLLIEYNSKVLLCELLEIPDDENNPLLVKLFATVNKTACKQALLKYKKTFSCVTRESGKGIFQKKK